MAAAEAMVSIPATAAAVARASIPDVTETGDALMVSSLSFTSASPSTIVAGAVPEVLFRLGASTIALLGVHFFALAFERWTLAATDAMISITSAAAAAAVARASILDEAATSGTLMVLAVSLASRSTSTMAADVVPEVLVVLGARRSAFFGAHFPPPAFARWTVAVAAVMLSIPTAFAAEASVSILDVAATGDRLIFWAVSLVSAFPATLGANAVPDVLLCLYPGMGASRGAFWGVPFFAVAFAGSAAAATAARVSIPAAIATGSTVTSLFVPVSSASSLTVGF